MRKFCWIIGLVMLGQTSLWSQPTIDTAMIFSAWQKAHSFLQAKQIDSAICYAERGLEYSEQHNLRKQSADCLHLLAKAYHYKEEIPLALRYYLQTLKIQEANGSSEELSQLHFELAELYEHWSVYEKAIQHYQNILTHYSHQTEIHQQALEGIARNHSLNHHQKEALIFYKRLLQLYEKEQKTQAGIAVLQQIIRLYKETGAYEKALIENAKMLRFHEQQKDTAAIIVALNNNGVLYRQLNQLDEALNDFIRSANLQIATHGTANPTTYTNIGIIHQNRRNFPQSLYYLFEAYQGIKDTKPLVVPHLAQIENLIAIVYLSMNDLNNAYNHNDQALALAQTIGSKELEQLSYKTRADIYEQFKDFEQALLFFRQHSQIKDSLQLQRQAERERNLIKQFSAEEAEKEISVLTIDREIEALKYRQDLLENEKLRQEQALQQSLLVRERLEKGQTEQALKIAQQQLQQEQSEQALYLTQQQLLAEQKDRQIVSLENGQNRQALEIARQQLEVEQKDKAYAQSEKAKVELQLSLQEKDFELKNQKEAALRNFIIGFLALSLIILALLFRNGRIRQRANRSLASQKQALETALTDLQQTQAQLLQSEKMASLGQLTAGVAHEINNPINFITSSIDALKFDVQDLQGVLNAVLELNPQHPESINRLISRREDFDLPFLKEELGELIDNIEIGASRTHDIVSALRTYSRDTSEQFIAADIHQGIDSSLIILNHKKGKRIEIQKDYGTIPMVSCMASRLNQVFLNILDNAIQAIEGPGRIQIATLLHPNQTVSIHFKDNGKGMDEHTKNNAFNPFFSTKEVGAGTGLGLYVSYNIIQQHHGDIQINSKEGQGTEFIITLPIEQVEQETATLV